MCDVNMCAQIPGSSSLRPGVFCNPNNIHPSPRPQRHLVIEGGKNQSHVPRLFHKNINLLIGTFFLERKIAQEISTSLHQARDSPHRLYFVSFAAWKMKSWCKPISQLDQVARGAWRQLFSVTSTAMAKRQWPNLWCNEDSPLDKINSRILVLNQQLLSAR